MSSDLAVAPPGVESDVEQTSRYQAHFVKVQMKGVVGLAAPLIFIVETAVRDGLDILIVLGVELDAFACQRVSRSRSVAGQVAAIPQIPAVIWNREDSLGFFFLNDFVRLGEFGSLLGKRRGE